MNESMNDKLNKWRGGRGKAPDAEITGQRRWETNDKNERLNEWMMKLRMIKWKQVKMTNVFNNEMSPAAGGWRHAE